MANYLKLAALFTAAIGGIYYALWCALHLGHESRTPKPEGME